MLTLISDNDVDFTDMSLVRHLVILNDERKWQFQRGINKCNVSSDDNGVVLSDESINDHNYAVIPHRYKN